MHAEPSPFAALVQPIRLNLQGWPEHARHIHSSEVPEDAEPYPPRVKEFPAPDCRAQRAKERMEDVLAVIAAHRQIHAAEIAKAVCTSTRTVYRDVAVLVNAGAPIAGTSKSGYRWMEPDSSSRPEVQDSGASGIMRCVP